MKKSILLLAAVLCTIISLAQAPNKMSYQTVVRDATGALQSNQAIAVRVSILESSASGLSVYNELHTVTTNDNGLASFEIGTGSVIFGSFGSINWSDDTYFLRTETDPNGGNNYSIIGTQQLLSVPYAMHAKTADALAGGSQWTTFGNNIFKANTGNVGINVTNPSNPLTLASTTNVEPLRIKGSDPEGRSILLEAFSPTGSNWELFNEAGGLNFCEQGVSCGRFSIRNGGNVGIGTGGPSSDLHIKQSAAPFPNPTTGGLTLETPGGTEWQIWNSNNNCSFAYENVRVAYVNSGSGAWVVTSDRRVKKDIVPMENVLAKVMRLNSVKYRYNHNSSEDPLIRGFIAQEVQEVFPELVYMEDGTQLAIAPGDFGILAIKAIQEQEVNAQSQAKRIEELENQLKELNAKIEVLLAK